ncbi:hypothetical protein CL632_00615 [bacterium]|jgi:hypothetical protein|nr:hypothetical protein [bacterium]MDP6756248.1 hypothetical protein [Patescibacteria group bacterium]|tara:strand:+ start:17448 stop:17810 length:363 start_codon:yes stop_codon:yes gene_type:complete
MSKILLTRSFTQELSKLRITTKQEIITVIVQYEKGLPVLLDLYSPEKNIKVLKGYIRHRRGVRIAVVLEIQKHVYVPFFIAKKTSREGWNLSKYSEIYLSSKIRRVYRDIKNQLYEKITI